jgi:hypothetical protein
MASHVGVRTRLSLESDRIGGLVAAACACPSAYPSACLSPGHLEVLVKSARQNQKSSLNPGLATFRRAILAA